MPYTTQSATAPVLGLRSEIDRLFEDTFRLGNAVGDWSPAVDVSETDKELVFAIEIPGVAERDVQVTTENGVLTVRGHRDKEGEKGVEGHYHLVERSFGTFTRRFQLPHGIDSDHIEAEVDSGMLHVHVRKVAMPLPTQIHITTGSNGSNR